MLLEGGDKASPTWGSHPASLWDAHQSNTSWGGLLDLLSSQGRAEGVSGSKPHPVAPKGLPPGQGRCAISHSISLDTSGRWVPLSGGWALLKQPVAMSPL